MDLGTDTEVDASECYRVGVTVELDERTCNSLTAARLFGPCSEPGCAVASPVEHVESEMSANLGWLSHIFDCSGRTVGSPIVRGIGNLIVYDDCLVFVRLRYREALLASWPGTGSTIVLIVRRRIRPCLRRTNWLGTAPRIGLFATERWRALDTPLVPSSDRMPKAARH
jgi:hypothetical protein